MVDREDWRCRFRQKITIKFNRVIITIIINVKRVSLDLPQFG